MKKADLTDLQKKVLAVVLATTLRGGWHRARRSGERVTLASLFRRHALLIRRVWRGAGTESEAHEYRAAPHVVATWREVHGAR